MTQGNNNGGPPLPDPSNINPTGLGTYFTEVIGGQTVPSEHLLQLAQQFGIGWKGYDPKTAGPMGAIDRSTAIQGMTPGALTSILSKAEAQAANLIAIRSEIGKDSANNAAIKAQTTSILNSISALSSLVGMINQKVATTTGPEQSRWLEASRRLGRVSDQKSLVAGGTNREFHANYLNEIKDGMSLMRARQEMGKYVDPAESAAYRARVTALQEETLNNGDLSDRQKSQRLGALLSIGHSLDHFHENLTPAVDPRMRDQISKFKDFSRRQQINKEYNLQDFDTATLGSQTKEMEKIISALANNRAYVDADGKEHRYNFRSEADKTSVMNQLLNMIKTNNAMMDKQTNQMGKFVTSILSTLGASQYLTKIAMTDPYQYGFVPAMGVLGGMGGMGGVVSQALSYQREYDQGLNMMGWNAGMGVFGTGFAMKSFGLGGGSRFAGIKGIGAPLALMAGGAGLMAASAGGVWDNVFKSVTGQADNEKFQLSLGQQLMNPQGLMQRYNNVLPLAAAWGMENIDRKDGKATSLGFLINGQEKGSRKGNTILDTLTGGSIFGKSLSGAGAPGADEMTAIAMQIGSSMNRNGASGMDQLSKYAWGMGKVFGTSAGNIVGQEAMLANSGVSNIQRGMDTQYAAALGTGATKTFAAEVLVPSLLRVTNSLALRNISANGEKLNNLVASYYSSLSKGDSNSSKMLGLHPELVGEALTGMDESIKGSFQNRTKMQLLMSYGIDPVAAQEGIANPKNIPALLKGVGGMFANYGGVKKAINEDGFATSFGGVGALQYASQILGISNPQLAGKFLRMGAVDPNFSSPDGKKLMEEIKKAQTDGMKKISSDDLTKTVGLMNDSADAVTTALQGFVKDINDLQTELKRFVSSDKFAADARNGVTMLVNQLRAALGLSQKTTTAPPGSPAASLQTGKPITAPTSLSGGQAVAEDAYTDGAAATGSSNLTVVPKALSDLMPFIKKFGLNSKKSQQIVSAMNTKNGSSALEALRTAVASKDPEAIKKALDQLDNDRTFRPILGDKGLYGTGKQAVNRAAMGVNNTGDLKGAQEVLEYLDFNQNFVKSLTSQSDSATALSASSSQAVTARSGNYQLNGYRPGGALEKEYDRNLRGMLMFPSGAKKVDGMAQNTLNDADYAKFKSMKVTGDGSLIAAKIKELKGKLAGTKDEQTKLRLTRNIETLQELYDTTSNIAEGKKGPEASQIWNRANQVFNLLGVQGGGMNYDQYGIFRNANGRGTVGGWGGVTSLSDKEVMQYIPGTFTGKEVGGWTGGGMNGDVAGIVHRNEYVISANNVKGNEGILNAIQSGQRISRNPTASSMLYDQGDTVTLVMEVGGLSPQALQNIIRSEVSSYSYANNFHKK